MKPGPVQKWSVDIHLQWAYQLPSLATFADKYHQSHFPQGKTAHESYFWRWHRIHSLLVSPSYLKSKKNMKHETLSIEFWVISTHAIKIIWTRTGQGIRLYNYINFFGILCMKKFQGWVNLKLQNHDEF